MALTNDQITAQNFKDFYSQIRPYLNGVAHAGFTPIGTVISVMGNHAPLNYLICNGQIVNIADYPELASYFNQEFGSINKFGGDGTTTFGIPDLRGEFLRGTGANSHQGQGGGYSVGSHQDGTLMPLLMTRKNGGKAHIMGNSDTDVVTTRYDSLILTGGTGTPHWNTATTTPDSTGNAGDSVTIRPTNTSVLYCIAYKNIFVDEGCNYSTDERVVGTWVDGKPLYQKTFTGTVPAFTPPNNSVLDPATLNIAMNCLVDVFVSVSGFIQTVAGNYVPFPFTETTKNVTYKESSSATTLDSYSQTTAVFGRPNASTSMPNNIRVVNMNQNFNNRPLYVTAQYTKTTD